MTELRVLVVEDDENMRALVCAMLRRMGVGAIESAVNGEAALQTIASSARFDLLLCDWTMPGVTGLEVLKQVREKTPYTLFVMTTGKADVDSVKQAKLAGAAGYLVKPFSAAQLKERIQALLTRRSR